MHAKQFVDFQERGVQISCEAAETEAIGNELDLLASFTEQGRAKLTELVTQDRQQPTYGWLEQLLSINQQTQLDCGNPVPTQDPASSIWQACVATERDSLASDWVQRTPSYQEECQDWPFLVPIGSESPAP